MQTIEELLRAHPFFDDFDPATVALLAGCATSVRFAPGEVIFREAEPADAFYVLQSGRVALQVHHPAGGALVTSTVEHDEVLGWSWLVPPYRWTADAVAVAETNAVRFAAGCLRGTCADDPAVGYVFLRKIAQVLAHRLASANRRLLDLYGGGDRP
nr:cyclic nucleotide-binding domain-containing protein [Propionibacterium sp.]